MVSVSFNRRWWGDAYDWTEAGDEWSRPWGGAEAQWFGSLYPRIHSFLPAGEILEIACGYGRWTQYLQEHCDHLTAIDLSPNCIQACQDRFGSNPRLRFVSTDGRSIPAVADASIDFAFSFDSLVHADQATMEAYLGELRRVLKPGGVAFIHHSNLGAYARRYWVVDRIPKLGGALRRARLLQPVYMRDPSVSAASVAESARLNSLRCIGQELTPWLSHRTMVDCISVIVPEEHPAAGTKSVIRNRRFGSEPGYVARVAELYRPRTDR